MVFSNSSPCNVILELSGIFNAQSQCAALVYTALYVGLSTLCVCVCENVTDGQRDTAMFYHSAVLSSLSETPLLPPRSF